MPGVLTEALPAYRELRRRAFAWRRSLSRAEMITLSVGFAALTGLLAQVRVPLVPVPMTGQVFAVLLAGVLLGSGYGALSQALYVALGLAGMPWFTGFGGGVAYLAGPTAGYLVGFVPAAILVGWVTDRFAGARRFVPLMGVMAGGVSIIYMCGVLHLVVLLGLPVGSALAMGVLPFIGADAAKAAAAAALGASLLPKRG